MKNYCIDCKKKIDKRSIRCKQCSNVFNAHKRELHYFCIDCSKEITKSKYDRCQSCAGLNRRKPKVKKYCTDCKKEITTGSKSGMCKSCTTKGERSYNFQHGKRCKDFINHCKDCNKIIGQQHERCHSCDSQGERNGMFGKEHSEKSKSKMSKKAGGTGIPYETAKYNKSIFTQELKQFIRQRDNYECQNCGMTEEEHLIVVGRTLHIHHIDYDKENCKEDNLITTCLSCNTRANYNRNYWQEFYKEKIKVLK